MDKGQLSRYCELWLYRALKLFSFIVLQRLILGIFPSFLSKSQTFLTPKYTSQILILVGGKTHIDQTSWCSYLSLDYSKTKLVFKQFSHQMHVVNTYFKHHNKSLIHIHKILQCIQQLIRCYLTFSDADISLRLTNYKQLHH